MFQLTPFGRGKRNSLINLDDFFKDDFFSNDFFAPLHSMTGGFRADVKETATAYEIEMDVPGMDKKDIEIHYINNQLTIRGKREFDKELKEENYIRRERSFGEFRRSFYVDNVDEEKIEAKFQNGVLQLILPKLNKEEPKGKKIDIH